MWLGGPGFVSHRIGKRCRASYETLGRVSKARLIITAVIIEGRSQASVARDDGVSKGWVSKLIARYRAEGDTAFERRSRRPHTRPAATAATTMDLVIELRRQLTAQGLDAFADTIAWHLEHHHHITVSRAAICRIRRAGLVTAEPKKKPKSSYVRFAAEHPEITTITLAELSVGPLVVDDQRERAVRQAHQQLAESSFRALPFDAAARRFGWVAANLLARRRKPAARAYDALIAAVALTNEFPLHTVSPADFQDIDGLTIRSVPHPDAADTA